MDSKLYITPRTKVAELLNHYPELEDELVAMTPAFEKLRNPVLRRTVARVTTLQNAAKIANIQVTEMVNTLRAKVGQEKMEGIDEGEFAQGAVPTWFKEDRIVNRLDARELIEKGEHPLGQVISEVASMVKGDIYELTTPFLPAPLIEKVVSMGYDKWTKQESSELFCTYFYKQS